MTTTQRPIDRICFLPDRNHRGRDYQGAFKPGADLWQKHHGGIAVRIDITRTKTQQAIDVIEAIERLERSAEGIGLAFFCHGFARELQLGISMRRPELFGRFVRAIARLGERPHIGLYCCSTGSNPEGFADALRDALCVEGAKWCQIVAHTTPGHAFLNSHKMVFAGSGSPTGGNGGAWFVAPGSKLWKRWRSSQTALWLKLPWMSPADVHTWMQVEHLDSITLT